METSPRKRKRDQPSSSWITHSNRQSLLHIFSFLLGWTCNPIVHFIDHRSSPTLSLLDFKQQHQRHHHQQQQQQQTQQTRWQRSNNNTNDNFQRRAPSIRSLIQCLEYYDQYDITTKQLSDIDSIIRNDTSNDDDDNNHNNRNKNCDRHPLCNCPNSTDSGSNDTNPTTNEVPVVSRNIRSDETIRTATKLFPPERVGHYIAGLSRVPKNNFTIMLQHELGIPMSDGSFGEKDILMIYSHVETLPTTTKSIEATTDYYNNFDTTIPLILDAQTATENCDHMNIILPNTESKQCYAIVPQFESQYVQKLMRLPPEVSETDNTNDNSNNNNNGDKTTTSNTTTTTISDNNSVKQSIIPFQYVSRFRRFKKRDDIYPIPSDSVLERHWDVLANFFMNHNVVLEELKIVLKSIATDNTVVVMVCNYGQVVLLRNFICSAQRKRFNLSNVIVFATDIATCDFITTSYNDTITAYYDKGIFGEHPTKAAESFADIYFCGMVMAKIRCALLVSLLGYDFLLQDVDVVWMQHPLQYFLSSTTTSTKTTTNGASLKNNTDNSLDVVDNNFDIYFQEDGARTLMYLPYSANSGFYFVKHNARTKRFFISLFLAGDNTMMNHNDQIVFNVLLNEQAILYGLKVKVFARDDPLFPGGHLYHSTYRTEKDLMKQIMNGTSKNTYSFHMSWTSNMNEKLSYLQQMGQWYVTMDCNTSNSISSIGNLSSSINARNQSVCSAEPIICCHYRDKPSLLPCPNGKLKDKDGSSWW